MAEFEHLFDDMELFFEELEGLRESGSYEYVRCSGKWLQENYDLSRKEAISMYFLEWKDKKEREVA
jgi:hypothetical protein